MANQISGEQLKKDILSDMRVELTEEFDRNFERKAFFTNAWKKRKDPKANGSLLVVTGQMRRSIKSEVQGDGVRFSSSVPYATVHNEGGTGYVTVREHQRKHYKSGKTYTVRAHQRRFNMPQRQFIGDSPQTQDLVRGVIEDNLQKFNMNLSNFIKTSK